MLRCYWWCDDATQLLRRIPQHWLIVAHLEYSWYLSFLLHRQGFWIPNITLHPEMMKNTHKFLNKFYTWPIFLHGRCPWQISGMIWTPDSGDDLCHRYLDFCVDHISQWTSLLVSDYLSMSTKIITNTKLYYTTSNKVKIMWPQVLHLKEGNMTADRKILRTKTQLKKSNKIKFVWFQAEQEKHKKFKRILKQRPLQKKSSRTATAPVVVWSTGNKRNNQTNDSVEVPRQCDN